MFKSNAIGAWTVSTNKTLLKEVLQLYLLGQQTLARACDERRQTLKYNGGEEGPIPEQIPWEAHVLPCVLL